MHRHRIARLAPLVILVAACSGTTSAEPNADESRRTTIAAQVASYEPVAEREQRFIVGLLDGEGGVVGFGEVAFGFAYLGPKDAPTAEAAVSLQATGTYRLVAGQPAPTNTSGPRLITASEGVGVYGADVTFDRAGIWVVRTTAAVDGAMVSADASFEVFTAPINPFPGQVAPKTVNRSVGDEGVAARSIDSRAGADGPIPDPELHSVTIADAITAGRPVMVVVSTPVYCISRFCGPITETVERLATRYGDRMAFVHVEVWNNYEERKLNREAAEWIYREGADPKEPWVFLVDAQGLVAQRWDNVSTDAELEAAVLAVTS